MAVLVAVGADAEMDMAVRRSPETPQKLEKAESITTGINTSLKKDTKNISFLIKTIFKIRVSKKKFRKLSWQAEN